MQIEESFTKAQPTEAKVQLTVKSIMQIAKLFHAQGWKDSDLFGELLGGRR